MCDEFGCGADGPIKPIPIPDDSRRKFLQGLASLPLAVVLSDPILAQAAGDRLPMKTLSYPGGEFSGALALPEEGNRPAVLLIHEWWGLNDQIKAVAAEIAKAGFIAFAIDLYNGEVATDRDGARALTQSIDGSDATAKLVAAAEWLRQHPRGNGKVGTIGWCFGGGWSLNASLAAPVDATVIYYGRVDKQAAELASLKSPVLGHFGTLDKFINQQMVSGFERAMAEAGKTELTVHWYEADHAFANPSGARYDKEDAALAWQRTLDFLHDKLG